MPSELKESITASGRKVPIRKRLVAGLALLLLIVLAVGFRSQILTGVADFLIINDPLQRVDLIFMLNGDYRNLP